MSVKRGVRDRAGAGAGAEFGLYHTVLGLVLGLGSGKGLIGLASTLILKQHSVKKVDHADLTSTHRFTDTRSFSSHKNQTGKDLC